jgi:hypothetical protein
MPLKAPSDRVESFTNEVIGEEKLYMRTEDIAVSSL